MKIWESTAHDVVKFITQRPYITLFLAVVTTLLMLWPATQLSIDASPDSLLLENDPDLKFYRSIHDQYGSDEYLIVAIRFIEPLLAPSTIETIEELRHTLSSIEFVSQVTAITSVPMIHQRLKGDDKEQLSFPTLLSNSIDIDKARHELLTNPLYESNLIDQDLSITAFKIDFEQIKEFEPLYEQRYRLIEKKSASSLSKQDRKELREINQSLEKLKQDSGNRYKEILTIIRALLDKQYHHLESYISGTPLIANDMKHYVRQDIKIFGLAVLIAMMLILFIIFHKISWVLITLGCSFINVVIVSGLIKLLNFNLTVVSSNYVAILLIFSLAIGIHVVIRYQEEVAQSTTDFDKQLYIAIQHISTPCLYMVLTSTVAFLSLIISDVQPVIVFGYIMIIGLCMAYIICFTILPLLIKLFHPSSRPSHKHYSHNVLDSILTQVLTHRRIVILSLFILLGISIYGISRLTVENRFVDYFKTTTDIHQGLAIIDEELGGTVPIEIILNAPSIEQELTEEDSEFDDYLATLEEEQGGFTSQSYWYNKRGIEKIRFIHDFLDSHAQIGKVLSLSSSEDIFEHIIDEKKLDDFQLSVIYAKTPPDIKDILIHPYVSEDGNQARIVARLKDSDHSLIRNDLLNNIDEFLTNSVEQPYDIDARLTGIGVLYNNVLQSLFRSQILTLSLVFVSIFIILAILFRSATFAFIATLPNIFTALFILGLMGLVAIPLNIMTITIAAITIGIGVDDAIHYIHRYKKELALRKNAQEAIWTSQVTVGKALWFTSITIATGFVLLMLSNFTPSIYFGLFTCMAMMISIFATFTIVPLALATFPGRVTTSNSLSSPVNSAN